jgi:hypothetical protein
MWLLSESVNASTNFVLCVLQLVEVRRGKSILRDRKMDERQNAERERAERASKMRKERNKNNRRR